MKFINVDKDKEEDMLHTSNEFGKFDKNKKFKKFSLNISESENKDLLTEPLEKYSNWTRV